MALWKNVRDVNKARMLFNDATLVAASGSVVSGWLDVSQYEDLVVGRTQTTGTYVFEVDWSADGAAALLTEAFVVANNTTLRVLTAAPYARFRVRNTDAVNAFTVHRTWVCA